ncbi:MAG: WYL domain-containing protein, partial [Ilumatobacteraceae bacterium]
ERPPAADRLADAVRRVEQVTIRYWSASTDSTTERDIVPRQVFADRGNWYVLADDHRSGERRTFRIDRIDELTPTERFHEPLDEPVPAPGEWFRDPDLERFTLRLDPAARWVVERYPVDEVVEIGDALEVVLPVASRRWLARLLVRLGPLAEVVAPVEHRDLGVTAAGRVLAVYDAAGDAAGDGAGDGRS